MDVAFWAAFVNGELFPLRGLLRRRDGTTQGQKTIGRFYLTAPGLATSGLASLVPVRNIASGRRQFFSDVFYSWRFGPPWMPPTTRVVWLETVVDKSTVGGELFGRNVGNE